MTPKIESVRRTTDVSVSGISNNIDSNSNSVALKVYEHIEFNGWPANCWIIKQRRRRRRREYSAIVKHWTLHACVSWVGEVWWRRLNENVDSFISPRMMMDWVCYERKQNTQVCIWLMDSMLANVIVFHLIKIDQCLVNKLCAVLWDENERDNDSFRFLTHIFNSEN